MLALCSNTFATARGNQAPGAVFTTFTTQGDRQDGAAHSEMHLTQLILVASTAATCAFSMAMPQPEVNLVARASIPCDKIEKYSSSFGFEESDV
jgi:hypothetical protein